MRTLPRSTNHGTLAKLAELSIAVPQVVALRTAQMVSAGNTPTARDTAEFSRMGAEKAAAFSESMFAMSRQMVRTHHEYTTAVVMRLVRLWMTPWWLAAYRPVSQRIATLPTPASVLVPTRRQQQRATSRLVAAALAPVHKRATANAKRLITAAAKAAPKRSARKKVVAKAATPVTQRTTSAAKRRRAAKKRSRS